MKIQIGGPPHLAPDTDLNWGSGGIVVGLTSKEIAHAMVAVWALTQDIVNRSNEYPKTIGEEISIKRLEGRL
jgi:hypothetical protein